MADTKKHLEQWNDADRRLRWASIVPLGLLIAFVLIAWLVADRLAYIVHWDRHSVEVLGVAAETEQSFINFETGVRGYELTRNEEFLQPARSASGLVETQFDNLKTLVADNPEQTALLELIRRDFEAWRTFSSEVIRTVGSGRAVDVDFNNYGKMLMDRIRLDSGRFVAAERKLLVNRSENVSREERQALIFLGLFFAFVSVAIVVWIRTQLDRQSAAYKIALEEQAAEASRFQVTLASIGDAVMVTDRNGLVSFMNKEAERMTGWGLEDAKACSLRTVFRIVNEQTRVPVDDPVEKVFREKRVVGLANHTVLISRSGVDWMIEDSASPILDAEGNILGVVLVFQDATERRRAQKDLVLARDEAIAASRAKDDFLATLSHELRTPLNPVLLIAEENANRPDLEVKIRDDFKMIAENVVLEARLIDDLLDLTKVSHRKISLKIETVNLQKILNDALGKITPDIRAKQLAVEVVLDPEPTWMRGDSARLEQVLWNVLRNAVKFTPVGGQLDVIVRRSAEARKVELKVIDTGIGMTTEDLAHAFEPFAQAKHTRDYAGGLGLGLTIARSLTEMHNGTIAASSLGRGKGSTIQICFPLADAPDTRGGQNKKSDDLGAERLPQYRILVVEDHAATAEALEQLLTRKGYLVVVAGSFAAAVNEASIRKFDLVISDLGLPDGTGYELMEILRAKHGLSGIATSGYGTETDIERAKKCGFAVHLTKPITFTKLEKEIGARSWLPVSKDG